MRIRYELLNIKKKKERESMGKTPKSTIELMGYKEYIA